MTGRAEGDDRTSRTAHEGQDTANRERPRGIVSAYEKIVSSTDLYQAGMTSYASVALMIAVENEFELEFPDAMLSRNVFESIDSIANAIENLQQVEQ